MLAELAAIAATATDINPADLKPGWAGAVVVFGLMGAVALLLWSFVRNSRRAREPWPGDDLESTDSKSSSEDSGTD